MTKRLILVASILSLKSLFGYELFDGLCQSSGQKNSWVKIKYYEASKDGEKSYAVKTELNRDGSVASVVRFEGSEPDFNVTKATTEDGEKIFILQNLNEKAEFYQAVCVY